LLFRQGAPPDATYFFKHALVQDAAYSLLLREPRRHLHARIAETLESKFSEIAENKPELMARHCAEAGDIEKAAAFWGKAGQRSAERSALIEATQQLRRALDLIATLPSTPALRRDEIKLQVELITPLLHLRGYAAAETRAAVDRARLLIERAEALGEPTEDPLLLFSVLYGLWVANLVAFNGDVMRELAIQFSALAEKQSATGPLMIAHRQMGLSLLHTGDIADARAHLDRGIALYDPAEHRHFATRFFGQDAGAAILCWRSLALLLLGYPDAALTDSKEALKIGRDSGHSATLTYALNFSVFQHVYCGDFAAANALIEEFNILKDQIGSGFWGGWGLALSGCLSTLTGRAAEAVQNITSGVIAMRSTGNTMWAPLFLTHLAQANAELGQFKTAWGNIHEAMTAVGVTKETWYEAEINRVAGEITLLGTEADAVKAEAYFAGALRIAGEKKAKSLELRAATSMARLLCLQGKRGPARDILAPVYGWFTEGFDTLDLREAGLLLAELAQDHPINATSSL
jgi:predicted ATPase